MRSTFPPHAPLALSLALAACPSGPPLETHGPTTSENSVTSETSGTALDPTTSTVTSLTSASTGTTVHSASTDQTTTAETSTTSTGVDSTSDLSTFTGHTDATSTGGTSEGLDGCEGFQVVFKGDVQLYTPADKIELQGVECIAGNLEVADGVGDLFGLESLIRIEGNFWLTGLLNPGTLKSMHGLENLTSTGGLEIWFSELESLEGLESLEEVRGMVRLFVNGNLHTLKGLSALHTITGSLYLGSHVDEWDFYWLQDLVDLQALRHVGQHFEIVGTSLVELDELSGLETVGGHALLEGNDSMPTCVAKAFLEAIPSVGGYIESFGNMPDACSP